MSGNWDDEDYDTTAQLSAQATEKIADLGLDVNKQQKASNSTSYLEDRTKNTSKGKFKTSSFNDVELTEKEKREAQLRADAAAGMDLFGITPDHKEKSFKDLQTKADFLAHAEKLGEEITERREHPHYLTFVNSLIEQMIGPMTKLQLEIIRNTVQYEKNIDVHLKREEEEQKKKLEPQKLKTVKKAKNKQMHEDLLEDEYDDYDEKFH
ncbi:hypothetical protein Mgra_00009823 [Meloidogyne graminicola]|uniref:Eukaryotic translation initiation factor 3 30 kDa subunit n=1 Tax=Meloidogyne graminicola TaxID=189291 RepID=A0A8S9ZB37_9BILA|nr:hypothetical protein Mgra_00009823 [Meloidogyne graminicola]